MSSWFVNTKVYNGKPRVSKDEVKLVSKDEVKLESHKRYNKVQLCRYSTKPEITSQIWARPVKQPSQIKSPSSNTLGQLIEVLMKVGLGFSMFVV